MQSRSAQEQLRMAQENARWGLREIEVSSWQAERAAMELGLQLESKMAI